VFTDRSAIATFMYEGEGGKGSRSVSRDFRDSVEIRSKVVL